MARSSGAGVGAAARHAEGEAEPRQQLLQLLERLLAEILDLEDPVLRLRDEIADRLDAGVLQAVRRAHREVELLEVLRKHRVELAELGARRAAFAARRVL